MRQATAVQPTRLQFQPGGERACRFEQYSRSEVLAALQGSDAPGAHPGMDILVRLLGVAGFQGCPTLISLGLQGCPCLRRFAQGREARQCRCKAQEDMQIRQQSVNASVYIDSRDSCHI